MKKLFTQKLFLLLMVPLVVTLSFLLFFWDIITTGTWGINKTVGWAWDITNFIYFPFLLYFIYLLGYGICYFLKIKTDYWLSLLHFVLILVSILFFSATRYYFFIFSLTCIGFIVFLVNIITSFICTLKLKKSHY